MASTDHGYTIHDLALVVEGTLHPLGPAPAASTPAYRAALRLTSILGVPARSTVQDIEDKLYTLLVEDDHDLTEVESAGYRDYRRAEHYGTGRVATTAPGHYHDPSGQYDYCTTDHSFEGPSL